MKTDSNKESCSTISYSGNIVAANPHSVVAEALPELLINEIEM
jgi:hypothetical protein